jgi:hypothetical protein
MDYFEKVFQDQKNNIAIDFDGVIHDDYMGFHDGTIYGSIIPHTKVALAKLSKNFNLILFTAKAKPDRPLVNNKSGAELVREWLVENEISDYISEITCEKPRALIYIDDKGFRFENWEDTLVFIEKLAR